MSRICGMLSSYKHIRQEEIIIRKVILTMDEQKKYEVIKSLADHPGASKDRAALTLGCSKRHINRMLKGYRQQGKAFFVHGNKNRQPSTTIPQATRNTVADLYRTSTIANCWKNMRGSISLHLP